MLSQSEADATTNDVPVEDVQPTQQPDVAPVLDPIGDVVTIDGITTEVMISAIDTGAIADLFDNNYDTLARGANQNPMMVSLTMREPVTASQLLLELAGMRNFRVDVEVTTPTDQLVLTEAYPNSTADTTVTIDLPESTQVTAMTVTITEIDVPSDVKVYIHIREFALLK
jgi:hypothetical protein